MMNSAYAMFRGLVAAAAAAGIAGCATPNLQPFGEQTARLADAISGEQRQITLKFQQVIVLYGKACELEPKQSKLQGKPPKGKPACDQHDLREKELEKFAVSRDAIDAVLRKTVAYATTLADLASAGETGAAAAKSLGDTLNKFGALAGLGAGLVSDAVNAMVTKVAAVATRVQAQTSLRDATAAADPAIDAIAEGIKMIRKADERILNALYNDELALAERLAGQDLVVLYEEASIGRNAVNSRLLGHAAALAKLKDCGPETPPAVRTGAVGVCDTLRSELRNAEELAHLLDLLRPEYQAYSSRREAAVRWQADRVENFKAIAAAVDAWKTEHDRATEQLGRCGGLRALRCASLDSASLKGLIDQINEIRSLKEK